MRHSGLHGRVAAWLLLQAAGAALVSRAGDQPREWQGGAALVSRAADQPREWQGGAALVSRAGDQPREWLGGDNQTVYKLARGERRRLELNATTSAEIPVYIAVSPCTSGVHWAVYRGEAGCSDARLVLVSEYGGADLRTISALASRAHRYVLQLSSPLDGAAAVSVRGEPTKYGRLRLRVRSRRRLSANWDPSPIDPQATTYCVVASHRRNYTTLCSAQYDVKSSRLDRFGSSNRLDRNDSETPTEVDNKIEVGTDIYVSYDVDFRGNFKRKKFSRSTTVSEEDPVIACVGDRTHHLMENLDPSTTYYVSVFAVGRDRRAGVLLATGSVRGRTSTAKRLRENTPFKAELRGRQVFYFKADITSGGGLWLGVSSCGGAVDVEVSVRGKRVYDLKNIDPHQAIYVPAPTVSSTIQETSDEGSVQFDSSSDEIRMRYVIRVVPSRRESRGVGVELTASTTRWGINTPELAAEDGATVRELRPRRSCRSVDIAFLPATHYASDVIRYCTTARETFNGDYENSCQLRKSSTKMQCVRHAQRTFTKVIVQRVAGLKPGRKYAIQVTAASKGNSVAYRTLFVDTNVSCKVDR